VLRALVASALAGASSAAAPLQDAGRQADQNRETFARSELELPAGSVTLRWRTLSWSEEGMRRMREDAAIRASMNQRFQLGVQSELTLPFAAFLGDRRLEAGSHRVSLAMDDAGAFELAVLVDHDTVRFPLELTESRAWFPYLSFQVVPAEDGAFALVFQWGREHGRAAFVLAR
jgi:hypothetical protein